MKRCCTVSDLAREAGVSLRLVCKCHAAYAKGRMLFRPEADRLHAYMQREGISWDEVVLPCKKESDGVKVFSYETSGADNALKQAGEEVKGVMRLILKGSLPGGALSELS